MNRSSEFGIPLPFLTYLPKKVKKGYGIPNSELLPMELPWQLNRDGGSLCPLVRRIVNEHLNEVFSKTKLLLRSGAFHVLNI